MKVEFVFTSASRHSLVFIVDVVLLSGSDVELSARVTDSAIVIDITKMAIKRE